MANEEHLRILWKGVDYWNKWRAQNPHIEPDLINADLSEEFPSGMNLNERILSNVNFSNTKLTGAQLYQATLIGANMSRANLQGANLWAANLVGTNFSNASLRLAYFGWADLSKSNLSGANLEDTKLRHANLRGANLYRTVFGETSLSDTDLSYAENLSICKHISPSDVDHRTIARSSELPSEFLRGCGLPNDLIEYYLSQYVKQAHPYYSCFISYSGRDNHFVRRIYNDLRKKGVRCWFAPDDLSIGAKIRDSIYDSIQKYDKLLIILSINSLNSSWVEDEINAAIEKENKTNQVVLFPIRIDDSIMKSNKAWAMKIKQSRNIGDFINWGDEKLYNRSFDRLLVNLNQQ